MRLHRMISILLLVEAKGKIKAKELADQLETSVRTIYRDIDALCEAGIPLTTDTGPNGGIHFVEGYTVGIKNFEASELINLYLNGMGIKPDKQSDMAMKVNNALLKMKKGLSAEINKDINNISKRFYVDDTPWWGIFNKINALDVLMEAIWKLKKINISYENKKGGSSKRDIRPYGIVVKQMDWYIIGYCEKSNEIRTFKCDRILECSLLEEEFVLPGSFSLEEYWNESSKEFINSRSEVEKYPVVIKIKKINDDVLKNFEIYKVEEEVEYIKATINLYKYDYAKDYILGLIGYGEVMSPVELRAYAKEELEKRIQNYR
ncbi:helix-turn-helix transcriptional regulator [Clostridium sp. UBA1652]|uniref:helix-turn-helix transcriptional regulator n=1 Tax=Clostridium sp. UBA1652 TaxID=1946348 RepID=UPI00257C3624|nr:YafY family protein [Clostridium sp. UBA1652]